MPPVRRADSIREPMLPLLTRSSFRALRAFLILVIAALGACSGSPGGGDEVVQISFDDTIEIVTASGEAPGDAPGDARGQGEAIVSMITDWYQQAFLDPAGWRDPKFPEIAGLFAGDARTKVETEIESVTIGDARDEVRSVKPDEAEVAVTIYVGEDGRTDYAVADVSFHGTGALKKDGVPLTIVQKAVYFLRLEVGGWRIFAYQARNDQAQNPPPGAAP